MSNEDGRVDRGLSLLRRFQAIFRQQIEDQASVASIVFLFAGFSGSDFCRVTDAAVDLEFFHES